jgi:hypothetical protein
MPKKESLLKKNTYIAVNIFFLIVAPFNLGYFGYNLLGELLPFEKEQVAGAMTANIVKTDNSVIVTKEAVLNTDNIALTSPSPSPITEPAQLLDERESRTTSRQRAVTTIYICVNDIESAHWSIFTHTKTIAEISPDELLNNGGGALLMYCQTKVRTKDIDSDITIIRRGAESTQELLLNKDELQQFGYVILNYAGGNEIAYELRSDRP